MIQIAEAAALLQAAPDAAVMTCTATDALKAREAEAARKFDDLIQEAVRKEGVAPPQVDGAEERLKLVQVGADALAEIAQSTALATDSLSEQHAVQTLAELAHCSIDQCAKIVQMGADACAKLEQAAFEEKQVLLDAAFDETVSVDCIKGGRIITCTVGLSFRYGMNVHNMYFEDLFTVESREGVRELIAQKGVGCQGPSVQSAVFVDAQGFTFDCELRFVEISQGIALFGMRICSNMRGQDDDAHDGESTATFALTKTAYEGGVQVYSSETQTSTSSEETPAQTDISWIASGMRCLRCARPPSMPGLPSTQSNATANFPSAPVGKPSVQSPRHRRHRRVSRSQSAPPAHQLVRVLAPVQYASDGVMFDDCGCLEGFWTVISSPLPNAWLRSLDIHGNCVIYGDGTRDTLECMDDGVVAIAGGKLFLDGRTLRRKGKSGLDVSFERVDDDTSETRSLSSFGP